MPHSSIALAKAVPLTLALILTVGACGGGNTQQTTSSSASTVPVTTTSTTLSAPTSTTLAPATTATTESPGARLPADACDQLDTEALRIALAVDEVTAGSPFETSTDGTSANCRFGITYDGNLGSAFAIMMYAPSATEAFETALAAFSVDDGEGTTVALGARALFYSATETEYTALLIVEYTNGAGAYAYADSDLLYGTDSPQAGVLAALEGVVGPVLLATP